MIGIRIDAFLLYKQRRDARPRANGSSFDWVEKFSSVELICDQEFKGEKCGLFEWRTKEDPTKRRSMVVSAFIIIRWRRQIFIFGVGLRSRDQ